jgi:hypothetical protein
MPVLPRLAGIAAALLLLASPLSATLPAGTSWTLDGTTRATGTSAFGSRTVRGINTVDFRLDGSGGFTYSYAEEPLLVYSGTVDAGRKWNDLLLDEASQDLFRDAIVASLAAQGIEVYDLGEPSWSIRARVQVSRGVEILRMRVAVRSKLTVFYRDRFLRLGLRERGDYRGPRGS